MFNILKRTKTISKDEEFKANVFKQYGDRCQRTVRGHGVARICGKKARDIVPRHKNLDMKERLDYRYYFPVCKECQSIINHELRE